MASIFNNNNLIAVLDIGSSKTCCVLAVAGNNKHTVVGAGSYQNTGVQKGAICNVAKAADSVRHAVDAAEAGIPDRIKTVVATACVSSLNSMILQDRLDLGGREVTLSDINRVIAGAQNKIPAGDEEPLHCIPIDYSIDSRHAISDPRGLTGKELFLSMHTVMASSCLVRDMDTVLEQSHLSCYKKVAGPYATGLACLTTEEKKQGSAVIDLGAETTGICVFYEDQPVYTTVIPFGGARLTDEIAKTFRTSTANAERIKTLKGSTLPSTAYDTEEISLPLIGEDEDVSMMRFPREQLIDTIHPLVVELFTKIKTVLEQTGFVEVCLNYVLTGGGSRLHGINEVATEVLQHNVRTGSPVNLNDKKGIIPPHAYAGYMKCIGLLNYTTNVLLNTPVHQRDIDLPENKLVRFFRWFLDNS